MLSKTAINAVTAVSGLARTTRVGALKKPRSCFISVLLFRTLARSAASLPTDAKKD
jgi:hypothetical protein